MDLIEFVQKNPLSYFITLAQDELSEDENSPQLADHNKPILAREEPIILDNSMPHHNGLATMNNHHPQPTISLEVPLPDHTGSVKPKVQKRRKNSHSSDGLLNHNHNGYDHSGSHKHFNNEADHQGMIPPMAPAQTGFMPGPVHHPPMPPASVLAVETALEKAESSLHYMIGGIQGAMAARHEGLDSGSGTIWGNYWNYLCSAAMQMHKMVREVASVHYGANTGTNYYVDPRMVRPYSVMMPPDQNGPCM